MPLSGGLSLLSGTLKTTQRGTGSFSFSQLQVNVFYAEK